MRNWITDEEKDNICLKAKDLTVHEISQMTGRKSTSIYIILDKRGINPLRKTNRGPVRDIKPSSGEELFIVEKMSAEGGWLI